LGTPPVEIGQGSFSNESEGEFETTILSLPAHTATHIDLVYPTRRLPLERMIGNGKLVDATQIAEREINIADVEDQVQIEKDDIVLFRTDWSQRLGTDHYFRHPELSADLIEWLASRQVSLVGIDAGGLGRGKKHRLYDQYLAERDIFVIENLTNLSGVPVQEFTVYCFPLRIEEIDAIPARVVIEFQLHHADPGNQSVPQN
jgi:kynurenine formamidase